MKKILSLLIIFFSVFLVACSESRAPLNSEDVISVIESRGDIEWANWTYNPSGNPHHQAVSLYLTTLDMRYRVRFAEFTTVELTEREYNVGVSNLRRRTITDEDMLALTETSGRNFDLMVAQNEIYFYIFYRIENTLLTGELRSSEYMDEFIDLINELKGLR